MRIIKFGRRYGIAPSERYKQYEAEFKAQCMALGVSGMKLNAIYNVKCVYYMQKRYRVDLLNLMNATLDCLVSAQVLEDDNCKIAYSHDGSHVEFDKQNPRVEIEIEEV